MATKSLRLAALEADLELTRLRLGDDLSALRGKLTLAGLAGEAGEHLRGSQGAALGVVGLEGNENTWRWTARTSPLLTLLGAGLAWLLLRSSRQPEEV